MSKKDIINKTAKDLAETLGLSSSYSVEWGVRYSLTKRIIDTVAKKSLTVSKIAKNAGTSRSRVTKILKDDTSGISLDVLFRVLGAIGEKVNLSFKKVA